MTTNEDETIKQNTQLNQPNFNQNSEAQNTINSTPGDVKMKRSYNLSSALIKDRIKQESSEDYELLKGTIDEDVLVVTGTYDHIHEVLKLSNIPFKQISPQTLTKLDLRPDQTIFVNCSNSFPPKAARILTGFVYEGGQLITTDWAIKYVIEVAFPGMIRYNNIPTKDEVVRIELVNRDDPVIKGFLDEETDPVWWLEGSSYPIEIIDTDNVEVLIRSKELGSRYEQDPVVVKFQHGDGLVYHMISHFYLQRTETRDKKQTNIGAKYAQAKGASAKTMKMFEEEEDIDYATVQSTSTSAEFVSRAIIEQKKRQQSKKEDK